MPVTLEIYYRDLSYRYAFMFTDEKPPGVKEYDEVRSDGAKTYLQELNETLKSKGLQCSERQTLPNWDEKKIYTYEDVKAKAAEEQRRKEAEELEALRREVEEQKKLLAAKDMDKMQTTGGFSSAPQEQLLAAKDMEKMQTTGGYSDASVAAKLSSFAVQPGGVPVAAVGDRSGRHSAGLVTEAPVYKPIKDFIKGYVPKKSCTNYILDECGPAFNGMRPGASAFFQTLVDEGAKVAESLLQFHEPPAGDPAALFAIVCYTADLRQFGAEEWQNFFDLINKMLVKRDAELIKLTEGYLHYLFLGLEGIPPMPEQVFARGIPQALLPEVQKHYAAGTMLHWSGVTSISEKADVAKGFAKTGGIIFWITARTARSIARFSAYPDEAEAILMPNWEGMVTQGLTKKSDGFWHLQICEAAKAKKYVF